MLPPPLGSISDIFEFENILMTEDPRGPSSEKGHWHIYIKKGQMKCFNLIFLGWGLKVTYNSNIFKKLRPPPGFKCPKLNFRFLVVFAPSPILENVQNFRVYEASPYVSLG